VILPCHAPPCLGYTRPCRGRSPYKGTAPDKYQRGRRRRSV